MTVAGGGAEPAEGLCRGCRCLGNTVLHDTEVIESVVCKGDMCNKLWRSIRTVVPFNLPSCFVPEGI